MGTLSFVYDYLRVFPNVLLHPTQEMRYPAGVRFRGGPEWPYFPVQVFARHCWGAVPRPFDSRPLPARPEWPFFDPAVYFDPAFPEQQYRETLSRLAAANRPVSDSPVETAEDGIWCGPIATHFGHAVADFGMRIAASGHLNATMPLVFSIWPLLNIEPPRFFWEIIDHLGIDRRRIVLIRKPTRFGRLCVLPQAERRFGGGPSRRHLHFMDKITGFRPNLDRDLACVFVSRSRLPEGRFAGESYLDEMLAASGVHVFHPETVNLQTQLRLYRRARRLIFAEGSAVHALQLLGHVDADIIVLTRRPGTRLATASVRPRATSLHYLAVARGLVHGLFRSGHPQPAGGMSVLDERLCLAGLKSIGIDLARRWDQKIYAERRDADIAAWIAHRRAAGPHWSEEAVIERHLETLSLRP